jgi:hypothetical protein
MLLNLSAERGGQKRELPLSCHARTVHFFELRTDAHFVNYWRIYGYQDIREPQTRQGHGSSNIKKFDLILAGRDVGGRFIEAGSCHPGYW